MTIVVLPALLPFPPATAELTARAIRFNKIEDRTKIVSVRVLELSSLQKGTSKNEKHKNRRVYYSELPATINSD